MCQLGNPNVIGADHEDGLRYVTKNRTNGWRQEKLEPLMHTHLFRTFILKTDLERKFIRTLFCFSISKVIRMSLLPFSMFR